MNSSENMILFVCMYLVLPLIYVMMRNLSKPKKNIILGVTLPYEARQEEAVQSICRAYRKHLTAVCIILTIVSLGAFIFEYSSVMMTYLMTWLLAAIIVPFISYTIFHRRLKRLKREQGWFSGVAGKVMLDTKVSVQASRKLSAWLFMPPVIICLIPLLQELFNKSDWEMGIVYSINTLLVIACYLFYLIIYRQRAEIVDHDTSLSLALTQVRRYNWGKTWMVISWATAFFNLGFWLFIWNNTGLLITTALYTAIILFVAINAEFSTRQAQERLSEHSGKDVYVDDDKYWINGMFYYNPHDKHIMINARVGINTSINLASPVGKAVMALSVLCLLALPFFGLWMMSEEFTPLEITVTATSVEARHTATVYSISLDDVRSAELIETLPPALKVAGTGMDTLLKGRFRVEGPGISSLCLNPQAAPFILIRTADRAYIFGTNEAAQTREVYDLLMARMR